jgi:DNA-binding transcriptional LysR family regulator
MMQATPRTDWDTLRVLLGLLRAGSFTAAGARLGMDETTVARRVAALERKLGARLFDRTPDGLRPTAAAAALAPDLERAEAALLSAVGRVTAADTRLAGFILVTASDVLATQFLAEGLSTFQAQHPGIRIELFSGYVVLDVARREADIAIRPHMPQQPQLVRRRLGSIATAVYAAPTYLARRPAPAPGQGLAGHDLIGFSDLLVPAPPIIPFHGERRDGASQVFTGNNLMTLMAAAEAGLGLVTLPCYVADRRPGLVRVWPQRLSNYTMWAVFHRDLRQTARIRAVVEHIARLFHTQAARLSGQT